VDSISVSLTGRPFRHYSSYGAYSDVGIPSTDCNVPRGGFGFPIRPPGRASRSHTAEAVHFGFLAHGPLVKSAIATAQRTSNTPQVSDGQAGCFCWRCDRHG
jgi:hypothetical protein